jgi:hypothetical protein
MAAGATTPQCTAAAPEQESTSGRPARAAGAVWRTHAYNKTGYTTQQPWHGNRHLNQLYAALRGTLVWTGPVGVRERVGNVAVSGGDQQRRAVPSEGRRLPRASGRGSRLRYSNQTWRNTLTMQSWCSSAFRDR